MLINKIVENCTALCDCVHSFVRLMHSFVLLVHSFVLLVHGFVLIVHGFVRRVHSFVQLSPCWWFLMFLQMPEITAGEFYVRWRPRHTEIAVENPKNKRKIF